MSLFNSRHHFAGWGVTLPFAARLAVSPVVTGEGAGKSSGDRESFTGSDKATDQQIWRNQRHWIKNWNT